MPLKVSEILFKALAEKAVVVEQGKPIEGFKARWICLLLCLCFGFIASGRGKLSCV